VVARGPQLMSGYWNRPEETAAALRDGWLWTGDAGSLDELGYLTIHDRLRDMVVTGGENVYPRRSRNVLLAHPSVLDAAVIGVPDETWGEAVHAVVVVRPGTTVDLDSLRGLLPGTARRLQAAAWCDGGRRAAPQRQRKGPQDRTARAPLGRTGPEGLVSADWRLESIFHFTVNATDFERSLAFYTTLGFRVLRDKPRRGLAEMVARNFGMPEAQGRGALLGIGDGPSTPGSISSSGSPPPRPAPGGTGWAARPPDHRPADHQRAGRPRRPVGTGDPVCVLRADGTAAGIVGVCTCRDPDGLLVELIEYARACSAVGSTTSSDGRRERAGHAGTSRGAVRVDEAVGSMGRRRPAWRPQPPDRRAHRGGRDAGT